jgi:hypothetical protein
VDTSHELFQVVLVKIIFAPPRREERNVFPVTKQIIIFAASAALRFE